MLRNVKQGRFVAMLRSSAFFLTCANLVATAATAAPIELTGTGWTTGCFVRSDGPAGAERLDFSAAAMTRSQDQFMDQDCQKSASTVMIVSQYKMGDAMNRNAGEQPFDYEVSRVVITVHAAEALTDFNSLRFCGISDWALEQPRDVGDRDCNSGLPQNQTKTFDLISMRGTGAEERLYFGTMTPVNDATSPAKRPLTINRATEYKRLF